VLNMFNSSKRTAGDSRLSATDSVSPSAANSSKSGNDIERELVRVAFKDTLRATGVPADWLSCEVRLVADRGMTERMQVHLVMQQWSGHLLRYAVAFQTKLRQCLDRYEPSVDHGQYEWLWRFSTNCACPFPTMPAPEEWAKKLEASKPPKPPELFERRKAPRSATAPGLSKPGVVNPAAPKPDLRDVFSHL
jgi:hypothetical protein